MMAVVLEREVGVVIRDITKEELRMKEEGRR